MTITGPFTTGPNLEAARTAVEKLMDDVLYIEHDIDGNRGSGLDEATGELTELYSPGLTYEGKGKVTPEGGVPQQNDVVGQRVTPTRYVGSIPLSAGAVPAIGDLVEVEYSRRDPNSPAIGTFVVTELIYSTFAVSRKFKLQIRDTVS